MEFSTAQETHRLGQKYKCGGEIGTLDEIYEDETHLSLDVTEDDSQGVAMSRDDFERDWERCDREE